MTTADRDAAQLETLVRLARDILGHDALAAYLHGSAVLGGLRPTSDTDVLVVTARPMSDDERRRLVAGILPSSGRHADGGPARPVELTVVVASDVRPWHYPPTEDFLYGEWERAAYETGDLPRRRVNPDLAPLLTMALAGDHALFGPPPAALLDPIPRDDLVAAVTSGIPGLLDDLDHDTRNVLLTLARILVTVDTGRLVPKDEAATYALERIPPAHRAVLRRAREAYLGPGYGSFDDLAAAVRPCAAALQDAINIALRRRNEDVV